LRVDAVEVAKDLLDGGVHAVEVHPVEARAPERAQPLDEREHLEVAPHPRREAVGEPEERSIGVGVAPAPPDERVDAQCIGPVGLDDDGIEASLGDEPLGDPCAIAIDLAAAMRRLAQEHEARVADGAEERIPLALSAVER
jgi:hypothetical protein